MNLLVIILDYHLGRRLLFHVKYNTHGSSSEVHQHLTPGTTSQCPLGHVVIQAHASLRGAEEPTTHNVLGPTAETRSRVKCNACKLNCPFRVWEMADSNPMKQMKDNDLTLGKVKLIRPRWPSSRRVDTTGWYAPWSVTCQGELYAYSHWSNTCTLLVSGYILRCHNWKYCYHA